MSRDSLSPVAQDLGLMKTGDESDADFHIRVLHSAGRFLLQAACLDDGFGGTKGVAKKSLNKRVTSELACMAAVSGTVPAGFFSAESVAQMYSSLVDIGELLVSDDNRLACAVPERREVAGTGIVTGFYDPTSPGPDVPSLSGLLAVSTSSGGTPETWEARKWWLEGDEHLSWSSLEDTGLYRFADAASPLWSVKSAAETGRTEPQGPLCIAAAFREFGVTDFYLVRDEDGHVVKAPVTRTLAQSLFLHLRSSCGNPAVVRSVDLGGGLRKYDAPLWLLPPESGRWLDAMSWPTADGDQRHPFLRTVDECAVNTFEKILKSCEVRIERLKNE